MATPICKLFYIRLIHPKVSTVYDGNHQFKPGKGIIMMTRNDDAIIAMAVIVAHGIDVAENLASEKIECRVIGIPTLKPIG